jgi:hypothetical protein
MRVEPVQGKASRILFHDQLFRRFRGFFANVLIHIGALLGRDLRINPVIFNIP